MAAPFDDADRRRLEAAGISEFEALRQLELLRSPPPPACLDRPATAGDGVLRLEPRRREELRRRGAEARDRGRVTKFVPASGAASRMFRALAAARARGLGADRAALEAAAESGDADARACLEFARELPRLALSRPLAEELGVGLDELAANASGGALEPILAALLDPDRMAAEEQPKALLPFHLEGGRAVTAFEEQLAEGLGYVGCRERRARFHFTVPPGRRPLFADALERIRHRFETGGLRLEVEFSEQSAATDTLALDAAGRPARDELGRLLLRPSGHGALLSNLAATSGDLVVVKNIDNVLPSHRHEEMSEWKLALLGLAAEAAERIAELLHDLDSGLVAGERLEEARRWVGETFGRRVEGSGDALAAALRRPLRICGVVPSAGEPGGGPFWCLDEMGKVSLQIVEYSQIDAERAEQLAVWSSSTHFNPVDLVVALRDSDGRSWDLDAFVDPASAFVARKSVAGRPLRVLERPGLWNGAMAGWNSVFVEVPGETFAPVKTVLDLARADHATTRK